MWSLITTHDQVDYKYSLLLATVNKLVTTCINLINAFAHVGADLSVTEETYTSI